MRTTHIWLTAPGWRTLQMMLLIHIVMIMCIKSNALLVSQSTVQKCLNSGDGPESCDKKLVVLLSVPNEQQAETESLRASLKRVTDETDAGETKELKHSIDVGISRSEALAAYRLTYWQTFNARPEELVAQTKDCKDFASKDATCSVYYDSDGNRIPGSEGFCCECDTQDAFEDTFENERRMTRGKLDCAIFENKFFIHGTPGTAHCLRIANRWFDAFNVDGPRFEFTINVSVSRTQVDDSYPEEQLVQVSPAEPSRRSATGRVLVELLGDFSSYAPVPDFSNKIFMWPRSQIAGKVKDKAMLVPNEMISHDGSECDKVGSSFLAFKNQPNRCKRPVGTCLRNTPDELLTADQSRLESGETPSYLLTRFTRGDTEEVIVEAGAFKFPVTVMRSSALRLEINADDLVYIQNIADGTIVNATLVDAEGNPAPSYEALSGDGYVYMRLNNTGSVTSAFIPSLNCTDGVQMIQSKGRLSIAPHKLTEFTVRIAVSDNVDSSTQRNCTAVLRNSQARIVDTKRVTFVTSGTKYDNINLELQDRVTADGAGDDATSLSCSEKCPNPVNVVCAIAHSCWTRFFLLVAIVIALLVVLPRLWRMILHYMSPSQPAAGGGTSGKREMVNVDQPSVRTHEISATSSSPPKPRKGGKRLTTKRAKERKRLKKESAEPESDEESKEHSNDGATSHATACRLKPQQDFHLESCYLVVSGLPRNCGNLAEPGPQGVLAGVGEQNSSGQWSFHLPKERSQQLFVYDTRRRMYRPLDEPQKLDRSVFSPHLTPSVASRAIRGDASECKVLN